MKAFTLALFTVFSFATLSPAMAQSAFPPAVLGHDDDDHDQGGPGGFGCAEGFRSENGLCVPE